MFQIYGPFKKGGVAVPRDTGPQVDALETKRWSELTINDISGIVCHFQNVCVQTCSSWLAWSNIAKFVPNPSLEEGNLSYDKFKQGVNAITKNPSLYQLILVFHGTPKCNVASILRDGLDPSLRNKQARGPGEYFAKLPETARSYCSTSCSYSSWERSSYHDCNEMVVFVVAVKNGWKGDVVVVEDNNMQLPIGKFQFDMWRRKELKPETPTNLRNQRKQIMDKRFQNLNKRIEVLELEEQRQLIASQIIKDLDRKQMELAGDLYSRYKDLLKGSTEDTMISDHVNHVHKTATGGLVVHHFFPGVERPCETTTGDFHLASTSLGSCNE